jgi:hypothetical protein
VRRVWAYLLVAIFGISLITPALYADESSNLPACCRRLGAHHCALKLQGSLQFPVGLAVTGVCGQYGRLATVLAQPESTKAAVFTVSRVVSDAAAVHSSIAEQNQILCRVSFSRARQKRGPPRPAL